jgi:hypothetical protein
MKQLDSFFSKAEVEDISGVRAIVVPHAGYVYSGPVAAYGFKLLQNKSFWKVIILAPSHQYPLSGAAVSNHTHYRTPLGEVAVSPLAAKLRRESDLVAELDAAQAKEHSAEIEVPFLQYVLRSDFEIVPVIVGKMNSSELDEFADLLIENLDDKTLIVASTDLSHYHPYDVAVALDRPCVDAIVAGDFQKASRCEMCGIYPVLTVMRIAQKLNWSAKLLKYANSGDVTGDRSAVVGYASIAFYAPGSGAASEAAGLSAGQKKKLLEVARDSIESYAREKKRLRPEVDDPVLMEKKGVFVTLEKRGQLRGCIGHLEAIQPLFLDVSENAFNAAFRDSRFRPVSEAELSEITIEVSVLSAPEPINASSSKELLEKLRPGIDGVILEYGSAGATYLPQVWEMLPEKEDFLSSLCEKAGLPADCWRKPGAKFFRYTVTAFKEGE